MSIKDAIGRDLTQSTQSSRTNVTSSGTGSSTSEEAAPLITFTKQHPKEGQHIRVYASAVDTTMLISGEWHRRDWIHGVVINSLGDARPVRGSHAWRGVPQEEEP